MYFLKIIYIMFCFLWLLSCAQEPRERALSNPNLIYEDTFTEVNHSFWRVTQQSGDLGSGAEESFVASDAVLALDTHVNETSQACLTGNNIEILNPGIRLSVRSQSFNCIPLNTATSYSGAELRSLNRYIYGRLSFSLRTSLVSGTVTSIFFYHSSGEIGFHFYGDDPSQVGVTAFEAPHSRREEVTPSVEFERLTEKVFLDFDTSAREHRYEILWLEGLIQWSIDGKSIFSIKRHSLEKPMRLVLSTWVSDNEMIAGQVTTQLSAFSDLTELKFENFTP